MNQYSGAATSTPAIAIALVVLVGLACGYRKLKTVGKVQKSQPWACGYAPNEHMPVVATTFASEVSWFMQPLYTLRDRCTAVCWSIAHFFQKLTGVAEAVEPVPDKVLVDAPHKVSRSSPTSRLSSRVATTASISATSSRHSWCSSCSPCKWVKEGRA